jgi:hypothetical protein
VPRVLGQTANGLQKKHAARSANQWTEENFFAVLSKRTSSGAKVAKKILDWTNSQKIRIWWGTGKKDGSFFSMIDHEGQPHWLIAVWTYGRVEIQFQMMKKQPPFSDEKQRLEFLAMLNAIPGVSIAPSSITIRPSIPLTVFEQETSLESFLKALDWAVAQIREM